MKKAIRKDLPLEIEEVVREKIDSCIERSSDYCVQFLLVVNAMAITMKKVSFGVNREEFHAEIVDGFDILNLLPRDFIQECNIKPVFSAVPIPRVIPDKLAEELKVLFTDQHLLLVVSQLFGSGAQSKNLQRHPLENFLFEELAKNGIAKGSFKSSLRSEERSAMNTRILTNVKNMWDGNKIFMKLLDRLLLTLLKLHLAAVRTRKYMKYLADKKEESVNKQQKEAVSGITSTRRRELVRLEYKKKMKYDQKFQETTNDRYSIQAKKCDKRIEYFKSIKSLPVRSKF